MDKNYSDKELRQWARDNYIAYELPDSSWHKVILAECFKMRCEYHKACRELEVERRKSRRLEKSAMHMLQNSTYGMLIKT